VPAFFRNSRLVILPGPSISTVSLVTFSIGADHGRGR
jgi:hypothetical protein